MDNQKEINDQEWKNPDNWIIGPGGFAWGYFSRKDTRLWVPKQMEGLGWTINFAHRQGFAVLYGIFTAIVLLIIFVNMFVIAGLKCTQ